MESEYTTTPAVEQYGVQEKVLELYRNGTSINSISKELAKENIKISGPSISRWIKKQTQLFKEKGKNELKTLEKFEIMTMDYENEIKTILDEVKEMKAIAIEQGKLDTYAKLVDRLYRGLELLAKLMGDIRPDGSVDINLIVNEINKETFTDNRLQRKKLFKEDENIIDVEAEVIDDDFKASEELKK
jgi:hypothetical protein